MYLKTLTVRGFKSFASATTLHFEPGITCVVGPNGSGKSNVVDALSWVMGEQGAKTLRGGKMEDVIFAGTSDRAPLGRAEVELTIDNSDGALPIEYTEVTIKRTMFRSGGSEYSINGEQARLLDVQELLSDSGIGHEMHVIVGQGRLDSILQATPEGRRGFIEEAAGVLKHRKRKEKALRKLDSTDANLHRLEDLLGELRRQLKPLARQASVARKAVVIQAEARDAKARLVADELVRATLALQSDQAGEDDLRRRRADVEERLARARQEEAGAEEMAAGVRPRLQQANDTWFALSTARERLSATRALAAERHRAALREQPGPPTGRDPQHLEREAAQAREQEKSFEAEVADLAATLEQATAARTDVESRAEEADRRYALLVQDVATRRETIASLTGRVNAARSRLDAAEAEIGRLEQARDAALGRAQEAERAFTARQNDIAGLDAGEEDLDRSYEDAATLVDERSEELDRARARRQDATQARATLAARAEALRVGMDVRDATSALVERGHDGLLGELSTLLEVRPGWEAAIVAALGSAAEALTARGLGAATDLLAAARSEDLGRAGIIVARGQGARPQGDPSPDAAEPHPDAADPSRDATAACRAVPGVTAALDVVDFPDHLRTALGHLLGDVVLADSMETAVRVAGGHPRVRVATADGDLVSAWWVSGGTATGGSRIEVRAAVEEAEAHLAEAEHELERATFAHQESTHRLDSARETLDAALARLHESDARMSAVADELGRLSRTAASAKAESERMDRSLQAVLADREKDREAVARASASLTEVQQAADRDEVPDPTERNDLQEVARAARATETDARLALRTAEERGRSIRGRADSLARAARVERDNRARAARRRAELAERAARAQAVEHAAAGALELVSASQQAAAEARTVAEADGARAEELLRAARDQVRGLTEEMSRLTDEVHRGEVARAEQRLRVDAIAERGRNELGLDPQTLTGEYGPDVLVPVLTHRDGSAIGEEEEQPEPVPFVRAEQEKRLRAAERNLKVLGNVNPLALEEYEAMQERHAFLATQLEDLQSTRASLLQIVEEVDRRVEQVFAEAYADVERTFAQVFSRLFPGGEGRLVLTEPGHWLSTGVEVEARPAGKKVKRLSLLSGGERSLVAVAFLVALFVARPSPFYILDEVEAALDDTNLGRLLEIYEELREKSQLLVITHQKRTMEVADALYGVTMRGDGVSTVISQRLAERS